MGRFNEKKHFGNGNQRKRPFQAFQHNPQKSHRDNVIFSSLKENEIGITEYTTKMEGFTGIIKQRISDFHVNEIGFDGNVCKITDFSLPKPTKVETPDASVDDFIKLVTQEKYNAILAIEKDNQKCSDSVLVDVTTMEKGDRTQIHNMIKEIFNTIASTTIDQDGKKLIKCTKRNKKNDHRSRWEWPHEYTYFLLHKENIDTMQAVSGLAPLLGGARASMLSYAGTKDKRAKTTQWVCIKKREPSLIVRAAQKLRKNIHVGGFMFKDQPLKLGQLKGNRFRIALRQISVEEEHVIEALEKFNENGFINYYGHQRFGNHASVPTHKIGLFLVQGNFKEACEWILKPRDNDVPELHLVRDTWWKNRNAKEALELLKRHDRSGRSIEYKLLSGFAKNGPNDFLNSLENIPRNIRLMYIHAYQSLIWNEMVSRRLATYGLRLCEGDLVIDDCGNTYNDNEILDDEIDENEENKDKELDVETTQQVPSQPHNGIKVKAITKTDIDSNKYSIFDLVMPLPGHDITYPANECAQWYEERLKQDDLTSEKLKLKQKTYSLSGAYRKAVIKPIELSWKFMKYNNESDTLIRSDIEELRGESEPVSIPDGCQKALIVEFSLPPSSYATMALREIMKCDTSVASQIQLQQDTAANNIKATDDNSECNVEAKQLKLD